MNDKVDFLHAGKHENSTTNWYYDFDGDGQVFLKKEVRDEVGFLHADKHQSGLQVDFNTLAPNLATRWYYDYW